MSEVISMSKNLLKKRVKIIPQADYEYYFVADVNAANKEILDDDFCHDDTEAVGENYNLIHECLLQAAE